jgi:hypothetical protein
MRHDNALRSGYLQYLHTLLNQRNVQLQNQQCLEFKNINPLALEFSFKF